MATESLTAHPGKYLKGDYSFDSINGETNPVGKGANNKTSAQIYLKTGYNAETWIYWPFDLSGIPDDATIDAVSCSVRAERNSSHSSIVAKGEAQLYTGTKAKGSATNINSNSDTFSLSCGTWTRSELQKCRLRLYAQRGSLNTTSSQRIFFYGADVTVTYTYTSGEKFLLKLGGSWAGASTTYKKVNGIWVEQTELANVIEDGVRYQNGGEYVPQTRTVTVTGTGNSNSCYLTINGNKVYSAGVYDIPIGDRVDCSVNALSCAVKLNGETVMNTSGTYTYTVTSDCSIDLSQVSNFIAKIEIITR